MFAQYNVELSSLCAGGARDALTRAVSVADAPQCVGGLERGGRIAKWWVWLRNGRIWMGAAFFLPDAPIG